MPSLAQLDVTFLLKNLTSSIIDQIDIHVIDSMSSKLINTTSANHISFPTISLFPRAQNYIHIYFTINAISFPQKLKTTLTYATHVSARRSLRYCFSRWMHLDIFRRTAVSTDRIQTRFTVFAILEKETVEFVSMPPFFPSLFDTILPLCSQRCICRFDEFRNIHLSITHQYSII